MVAVGAVTIVEVTNSTVEADGSRRIYWLHVPPQMRRGAVAWTFGLRAKDYRPARQT